MTLDVASSFTLSRPNAQFVEVGTPTRIELDARGVLSAVYLSAPVKLARPRQLEQGG